MLMHFTATTSRKDMSNSDSEGSDTKLVLAIQLKNVEKEIFEKLLAEFSSY